MKRLSFPYLSWATVPLSILLSSAFAPVSSWSQESDESAEEEKVFELNPFVVQADRDVGFVAATSMAGGRMSTDLSETAAAYSVQTKDFLEALNISDLNEALDWTVNATTTPDDGGGQLFGGTGTSTIRGVRANTQNRDFFAGGSNAAAYNVERLDYARGPNSVLFGTGSIGGTANVVVKRAQLGLDRTELRFEVGSWDSHDMRFDVNRKVTSDISYRVVGTWSDSHTWRDWERTKRRGIAPGISVRFNQKTRLTVMGDYYEQEVTRGMAYLTDSFSGWDGVTTYRGFQPSNLPSQFQFGASRYYGETYIWSPASGIGGNTLLNYEGSMRTQGYQGQHPIDGVQPLSTSLLGLNRAPILDQAYKPEGLFDAAIEGSEFRLPSREFTAIGPNTTSLNRFGSGTFYLDHRVDDSLTLQLSGNRNEERTYGRIDYYTNQFYPDVFIDLNELLPDGSPNPNFLKPYNQFIRPERQVVDSENESLRFAAAYDKSFGWLDLKGNVILGYENEVVFSSREYQMLPVDPDPRVWGYITSDRTETFGYRYYWDQKERTIPEFDEVVLVNPVDGTTTTYHPEWVLATDRTDGTILAEGLTKYYQGSVNMGFFDRRVILLGAYRWDQVERSQKQFLAAMDHPEGTVITRDNFQWRPDAPDDYWNLTYVPKDSRGNPSDVERPAVTRPRDGSGVGHSVYADDRFQDDYNPPSVTTEVGTTAFGAIFNIGWGLSLWGNVAETFNPANLGKTTIDYGTPNHSVSEGTDVGIRYSLGPKLSATLSYFESTEENAGVTQPSGYTNINLILQTNALGDFSYDGRNIRNLGDRPPYWNDVIDRETEGWEFEVVANPTPSWRITFNYGWSDAAQTDAYRQTRQWVDGNEETLRLILDDAGVQIDEDGIASLKPDLDTRSPDSAQAINAWNNLRAARANWVTGRQPLFQNTRYTLNFYTDYRFREGFLSGFRIGYGMQFRGRMVIGWRGADTMVDPNNPNAAIDDPTVDALTPVWRGAYYTATLTAGYNWQLSNGRSVYVNLSIDNLFDYDTPIYYNTTMRPPEGDLTTPARVAVENGYYYKLPINFRLSAKYTF